MKGANIVFDSEANEGKGEEEDDMFKDLEK